jgi:hypothetical protein
MDSAPNVEEIRRKIINGETATEKELNEEMDKLTNEQKVKLAILARRTQIQVKVKKLQSVLESLDRAEDMLTRSPQMADFMFLMFSIGVQDRSVS